MPTLIVENVPRELYDRLQQRAAAQQRSLPEEVLHLLEDGVRRGEADKKPWTIEEWGCLALLFLSPLVFMALGAVSLVFLLAVSLPDR
jgi:hypothetical protein